MAQVVQFPNRARARSSSEERLACYSRDQAFGRVAAALELLSTANEGEEPQRALEKLSASLLDVRHIDQRRSIEDAIDDVFELARRLVRERSHKCGKEELLALELYLAYANLRSRLYAAVACIS